MAWDAGLLVPEIAALLADEASGQAVVPDTMIWQQLRSAWPERKFSSRSAHPKD
jgi:hypothetical protein